MKKVGFIGKVMNFFGFGKKRQISESFVPTSKVTKIDTSDRGTRLQVGKKVRPVNNRKDTVGRVVQRIPYVNAITGRPSMRLIRHA